MQAHGQAGSKLLTVREGGAAGDVMVTSVDRRHPLLTGHRPWSPDECAGSAPPPPPPAGASVSGSPREYPVQGCCWAYAGLGIGHWRERGTRV